MIHAGFFKEEDTYRVIISGHANFAPHGQDIVCASVSTLFYTLLGYLKTVRTSRLKIVKIQSGYAEIMCDASCEEFLRMICIGILQVCEQYPQCVTLHNNIWKSRLTTKCAEKDALSLKSGDETGVCIHGRKKLLGRIFTKFRNHRNK